MRVEKVLVADAVVGGSFCEVLLGFCGCQIPKRWSCLCALTGGNVAVKKEL